MDAVKLTACALFLVTGAAQLVSSRARQGRLLSALMLLSFGVALTLTLDSPYRALDRATGVPNLAELLSHLAGLTGIGVMTYLLLHVDGRPRTARQRKLALLGVALVTEVVLFALSDVPREASQFTATYGNQTSVLAFWAVSAVYALVCLMRLARTVSRSTPVGTRRDVVHGMRIAAVGGGAFGVVYIGLKGVEVASARAERPVAGLHTWQQAMLAPGMACLALGLGLPLSARILTDARQQFRVRRSLIRLRPLRRQLAGRGLVGDDGPLLSSRGSVVFDLLGPRPDARLLRRVVEVRDGLLLDGSPLPEEPTGSSARAKSSRSLDLLGEADRLASSAPYGARTNVST